MTVIAHTARITARIDSNFAAVAASLAYDCAGARQSFT